LLRKLSNDGTVEGAQEREKWFVFMSSIFEGYSSAAMASRAQNGL
jgi:hypothetical protein